MRLHSVLFVNVAALLVMAGFASSAQALVQKVVKDNVDSVAEYAYRSGGTGISGGNCGSSCTSIWNVQHTSPPNPNPTATEAVNRQLVELDRNVKTLPKASLIGRISLAAGAFSLGLWIGDTVNDKLLHIGGPAAPASPNYKSFSLVWLEKGIGLGDSAFAPQDGFYLEGSPGFVRAFKRWTAKSEGACSNLDPKPSEYLDFTVGKDECYLGGSETGWRELHAYVYDKSFQVLGPIEDFDEDKYDVRIGDWPEEPASMEELETRVEDVIESDELPLANAHFAHALEPENFPDPRITDEKHDHRCDRAPGASYMNPGGNVSPEPFAKHIGTPFTITNRPEGYASVDVYFHEGTTNWIPGHEPKTNPWYVDAWGGWGYRHILAKHGWGAADLEETQLALASAMPEQEEATTNYLYSLPLKTGGDGGVGCIRHVVVDFEASLGDARPRGIVTSFNQVVP